MICNLLSSYLQEERDAGRSGALPAVIPACCKATFSPRAQLLGQAAK